MLLSVCVRLCVAISRRSADVAIEAAWGFLLEAAGQLGAVATFRFDLVDLGRRVIASKFADTWGEYSLAFKKRNATGCARLRIRCLAIIDDYDSLLSTDPNFLLGRWLNWSAAWAHDEPSAANLEYNARNQLTLWGPSGQVADYAKKEYSGLVRSFYRPRYELLFSMAEVVLQEAATSWNQTVYARAVRETVEIPWQTSRTTFSNLPEADAVTVSSVMHAKYCS